MIADFMKATLPGGVMVADVQRMMADVQRMMVVGTKTNFLSMILMEVRDDLFKALLKVVPEHLIIQMNQKEAKLKAGLGNIPNVNYPDDDGRGDRGYGGSDNGPSRPDSGNSFC
jgi:hypothetical protein